MATPPDHEQMGLFDEPLLSEDAEQHGSTPADLWNIDITKHALDELLILTDQYSSSESYQELIDFVARFRFYSPYNAMLIHIQMPGATFVAPAHRWIRQMGAQSGRMHVLL